MDMIWFGIIDRKDFENRSQKRTSTYCRYVFGRISENYRRVFEKTDDGLTTAYKEAQLLTDMIAGMTDSFALQLHRELKSFEGKDFKLHMAQAK
jgi:dGTPase